jgi:hypothetical protein
LYDEIVRNVDLILSLHDEIITTKLDTKINHLKNRIDYCESRINEIVYQLYGLIEEEIGIIEGK